MIDIASAMAVLQHGDSFFPSGSASFSWGLESLVKQGRIRDAADAASFVSGQLHGRWAGFDRPIVVASHRASRDMAALAAIDWQVEIQSPVAELRSASRRLGDAMLSVFSRLGFDGATLYRSKVKRAEAHGHVPVVQGFLWAMAGNDESAAVALSAHTFATGLLGAGIRLGCISHIDAQRILGGIRAEVSEIANLPVPPIDALTSCIVEAEIAIIHNTRQEARLFAT